MMDKRKSSRKPKFSEKMEYGGLKTVFPMFYDWSASCNVAGAGTPLACRWGAVVKQFKTKTKRNLFFSEEAVSKENEERSTTLVRATCVVDNPAVATIEQVSEFKRPTLLERHEAFLHPGKVKRIREFTMLSDKTRVATLSDGRIHIWDFNANGTSKPTMTLKVLDEISLFQQTAKERETVLSGLALCPLGQHVLSGGHDSYVHLWDIGTNARSSAAPDDNEGSIIFSGETFKGHDKMVRDVQFHPESHEVFCSVGDDCCLMFWDSRDSHQKPTNKVEKAHLKEICCVDWSKLDDNYLITGSEDCNINLFDWRYMRSNEDAPINLIHTFREHKAPVESVQWCPDKSSVFASSARKGCMNVWDNSLCRNKVAHEDRFCNTAPELVFQHLGQMDMVEDFHWITDAFVSVCSDAESTLQIWRMKDYKLIP